MVSELYFNKTVIKTLSKCEMTSKNRAPGQSQFSELSSSEDLFTM